LKNKHLLPLLGRPVIEYTFDAARNAQRLTHVVVTSDSPDILTHARAVPFEAIERPAELATSDASVQATCLHAMLEFERRHGAEVDAIVVLYGNVAVRDETVIDRALELLQATQCDSVRSLSPVGKWHPAWMHRLDGNVMQPFAANNIHRRQDLEPIYLHDGAAVAVSRRSMLRGIASPADPHAFFGVDRRGVVSEMDQTVEIDHQRDLYWAEAVLRQRQAAQPPRRISA
jgi:CMP-N-acetylneuraminic acid synthetase